jgi:hypothetical protein
MACIVQFCAGAAREVVEAAPCSSAGAEIIIFPGVRRERHAEPQRRRPVKGSVKGSAERDILELPD